MDDQLILVTGGTGFIAQHCILALLKAGYRVRTTIRSLAREAEVRAQLMTGGAVPGDRLSFAITDLTSDAGWAQAAAGCAYVLHGASPTPTGEQVSEADWIKPAVDGNLRVLRAARDAAVKRVVLTSAFGAICAGHKPMTRPFNETDWSDLTGKVWPYQKSKALAERAAWDFVAREGRGLELTAVNAYLDARACSGASTACLAASTVFQSSISRPPVSPESGLRHQKVKLRAFAEI